MSQIFQGIQTTPPLTPIEELNVDVVDSSTPALSPGNGTVTPRAGNIAQITGQNGILTSELTNTAGAMAVRFDYDDTTTTGAATATLLPLTTASNCATEVYILVAAYDSANQLAAGGKVRATLKNIAGTVSVVATPDILLEYDAALTGITMTISVSGAVMSLSVTGIAGHDLTWNAILNGTVDTSGTP